MWVVDSGRINSGVAAAGAAKLMIFNLSSSPGTYTHLITDNSRCTFFRRNTCKPERTTDSLFDSRLTIFAMHYALIPVRFRSNSIGDSELPVSARHCV